MSNRDLVAEIWLPWNLVAILFFCKQILDKLVPGANFDVLTVPINSYLKPSRRSRTCAARASYCAIRALVGVHQVTFKSRARARALTVKQVRVAGANLGYEGLRASKSAGQKSKVGGKEYRYPQSLH